MSGIKHHAASLMALAAALSFGLSIASPGTAASTLTSFQFTTTVDATQVGGSPTTPFRVTYQFDPTLANGSGGTGTSETNASYGPLQAVILEVGTECAGMSGSGTEINVFNNAGPTALQDSYDMRADNAAVTGKSLFGYPIYFFRILLADDDGTMFSDTSLPVTTSFATAADFQQSEVRLSRGYDDEFSLPAAWESPFQLQTFDASDRINSLINDVKALPVSSALIDKLVSPLKKANTLLQGTLTQKAVTQAREALDEFRKVVQTNRNKLGSQTADQLTARSVEISRQIPRCGV